ncbi:hypothetical protein J2W51_003897 [Tardiphaga robiniae]|nr:hypothetical protein [Tardiphaga robiniae]
MENRFSERRTIRILKNGHIAVARSRSNKLATIAPLDPMKGRLLNNNAVETSRGHCCTDIPSDDAPSGVFGAHLRPADVPHEGRPWSKTMKKGRNRNIRALLILSIITVGLSTNTSTRSRAETFERWDRPAKAPIGSLQPRGRNFSTNTPANRAEQRRLSRFNASQKRENRKLDDKLNICRC